MPKHRTDGDIKVDDTSIEVIQLRGIFEQLGRALALTAMAVKASSRLEDEAIEAMDGAWIGLADKIIEFAELTA